MKKVTTNFGHSVRTRLLAVANERRVQLEYVLLRYAFERFLYRLGRSAYANRFVLVIERLAGFLAPVLNDDESVAVWRQPLKKWCKEVL